jgi:class 3 adenylate cyclase
VTISAHRKVVTVVFCDVVGSTALGESVDPEALQGLLAGYFERMKGIVEWHEGSVEKFIGDAVMAVFGVPVAHEDDALRACRAAVEMRDALPELDVEGRIGVNTGEVLTGTEERLATGDAVNVAARLEQAAEPGEVLIGAETRALVGATVEVGDERLLALKGKSEPVAAYPLLRVREVAERSHGSRFVGREQELQRLADAWDRAVAGPRCELVTLVGDPGVGKSRLVAEVLQRIEARVVRGRCLSYGEGITYWPVVEVVKQLSELPSDEAAASAIRSLIGESDTVAGTDELAWAFRKLLEEQAPLIVCFDDIQWGEETFLDLVESTALLSTGAPLLLLCMARPELLDRRPGWPATLRLEPLPEDEAYALIGEAVPGEVRERIVGASAGNPLFLTEMVALSAEGAGEVEVPPTLRALLAARLDQLEAPERLVLERGSVEGELFHSGTVQALAPEETAVTPRLAALVRRNLIYPDRPQLPREDAYRFRHLLIRDAAYDALPKATRADLHRRFAEWLEEHGQSLVELGEILGYHLEQAAHYLAELGQPNPQVALAAGDHLAGAGRRAYAREDAGAAANLIERGLALTRPTRLDVHLELDLAQAYGGRDLQRALSICETAAEHAAAADDATGEALARVMVTLNAAELGRAAADELEAQILALLPQLEEAEDHRGLALAWGALAYGVANTRGQWEQMAQASEQAIRHSRALGLHQNFAFEGSLVLGSCPADEAVQRLDGLSPEFPTPIWLLCRAWLLAMLNRFDEAWPLAREQHQKSQERGEQFGEWFLAEIAMLAGDHADAARRLRLLCLEMEQREQRAQLSTYAPTLGRILCVLGRFDEAEPLAIQGRELGDPQDASTQMLWRQVKALVLANRSEHEEAEHLAREAVEIADTTDGLTYQGDVRCDLADVLLAAGRAEQATVVLGEALDRYERKKNLPLARRVRERIAMIQPAEA